VLPVRARTNDIDVLFCPNGNGPLHTSSAYETVLNIHDINAQHEMSSPIHQAYRKTAVPRAARVADLVTTPSEFSKSEIVDSMGIDAEKVHVVHNGIDDLFRSDDPGEPFDLPERYVLFVGALNPRKNVSRLLRAFDTLKSNTDLPHKLVLVGPRNKRIFKRLDVQATDDVLLPGYVTDRELKYAYRNADLFAYPSLYEGFGLPPIEAMACGTPVVSSTTASLPEVIGDAGELVDPTSTEAIACGMERVLDDIHYRDQLIAQGRERAERFTWERAADEFIQLFEGVS
jgi:glycosyltransferase involved in cell wall biosynthesis